jgi:hypothetical protein
MVTMGSFLHLKFKPYCMPKKNKLRMFFPHALLAAILYIIPVFYFIMEDNYGDSYFLYIGNVLFAAGILVAVRKYNSRRNENALTMSMLSAGITTSIIGIIVAFLLLFLIVAIDIPHLFNHAGAAKQMTEGPANIVKDSTKGLKFMLFMNDVLGNILAGAFVTVFYSFTAKRDQSGQTAEKIGQ